MSKVMLNIFEYFNINRDYYTLSYDCVDYLFRVYYSDDSFDVLYSGNLAGLYKFLYRKFGIRK